MFFIVIFVFSSLEAKESCIIAHSSKVLSSSAKKRFLDRFPDGVVFKYGGHYEYKLENFQSYHDALKKLPNVKRYYRDAFIINCAKKINSNILARAVVSKGTYSSSEFDKPVSLNEVNLNKREGHIPLTSLKVSIVNDVPKLNEPKFSENYGIPLPPKMLKSEVYDIFNFKKYIDALFEYTDKAKEAFYQKKIDYLLSEIKKDKYNFDVFVDAYVRTGTAIGVQNGNAPNVNGDYTGAGTAVHVNKLLYDGGYSLINNTYDVLYKRLADIEELNAKDKLVILGTSVYSNLYVSQENLRLFKKIYEKQKLLNQYIKEGYKKGKISKLDYIDSKNDLFNLKRTIMDLKYQYLHNSFILRHSIKSKSKRAFKLYPEKVSLNVDGLVLLQKEAINHSSDIARESSILKIKQTDLIFQKRRYYPKLDFQSYLGYGLSKDNTFDFNNYGKGKYWEMGLYLKIPIYNRNDIRLNEQKETYNILREKAVFSSKQRDVLIQVDRSYHEIKRIKEQMDIIKEQLSLVADKLKIVKKRYMSGMSPYKDYSDAVKGFINYENQLLKIEQKYIQEVSILSILVGKRDFYEQN